MRCPLKFLPLLASIIARKFRKKRKFGDDVLVMLLHPVCAYVTKQGMTSMQTSPTHSDVHALALVTKYYNLSQSSLRACQWEFPCPWWGNGIIFVRVHFKPRPAKCQISFLTARRLMMECQILNSRIAIMDVTMFTTLTTACSKSIDKKQNEIHNNIWHLHSLSVDES